ncbi:MAG: redoxin domain-containing protein [Planctomycetota bacterium]|jgi:peroxiredoxin
MTIEIGADAPDFTLKNQADQDWTLSANRGKKVILLWYPLDWSPTCEGELCSLSVDSALDVDADTVVVGISRDSVWSHKAFAAERGITHDLLADPMLEVTGQYGLVHPKVPFISHRATVIVDREGKVAFCEIQESTGEPRNLATIQDALDELE